MHNSFRAAFTVLVVTTCGAMPTSAATLDQEQTSVGFVTRPGQGDKGQTFTVGLDGLLDSIEVSLARSTEFLRPDSLTFELRQTINSLPRTDAASLLFSHSVLNDDLPASLQLVSFDVSSAALSVKSGDVLAFILHQSGPGIGPAIGSAMRNPYTRGFLTTRQATSDAWGISDFDMAFRTFVSLPAPWRVADVNGDGTVSVGDLGILATHFNQTIAGGKSVGDLNLDGSVTVGDLGLLATYFGQPGQTTLSFDDALKSFPNIQPAVVPEPLSSLAILLLVPAAMRRVI